MNNFNLNTENNETWLTPPEIIRSLGPFDLDPCAPIGRPWDTAYWHYTIEDNGLLMPWEGRVWLNPPYGRQIGNWLNKMALHCNGIALIFARTDTAAWQNYIFPHANSLLFITGRLNFCKITGEPGDRANAPSVLVSYTDFDSDVLDGSGISGAHIPLNPTVMLFHNADDRTWKVIVGKAMADLGQAELSDIYEKVRAIAPKRVNGNKHFKAKIRQVLQMNFENVERGKWSA